jgi:hypothetical protein
MKMCVWKYINFLKKKASILIWRAYLVKKAKEKLKKLRYLKKI